MLLYAAGGDCSQYGNITGSGTYSYNGSGGGGGGATLYCKFNFIANTSYTLNVQKGVNCTLKLSSTVIISVEKGSNGTTSSIGGQGGSAYITTGIITGSEKRFDGKNGSSGGRSTNMSNINQIDPPAPTTINRTDIDATLYDNILSLASQISGTDITGITTSTGGGSGYYGYNSTSSFPRTIPKGYADTDFPKYSNIVDFTNASKAGIGNGASWPIFYPNTNNSAGAAYIYFVV
jgi:hypothetical protein